MRRPRCRKAPPSVGFENGRREARSGRSRGGSARLHAAHTAGLRPLRPRVLEPLRLAMSQLQAARAVRQSRRRAPPRRRGRHRMVSRPLQLAGREPEDHSARPERELAVGSVRPHPPLCPATVQANVLEPVDLGDAQFDSIGANYLFHCLPGGLEWKTATVASNLRPYLARGVSSSEARFSAAGSPTTCSDAV